MPCAGEWWLTAGPAGGALVPPYVHVGRFIAEAKKARWLLLQALCRAATPAAEVEAAEEDDSEEYDADTGAGVADPRN